MMVTEMVHAARFQRAEHAIRLTTVPVGAASQLRASLY